MTFRLERAVWIVALAAALVHMAPYWHAQATAEPGWTFTGNIHSSPDFVQYRAWPRQTVREGPIITDSFTSEENDPHLPVIFYWSVGGVSELTGASPEWILAYLGAVFAAGLTLLIIVTVRSFVPERAPSWWISGAILLGGGLGAHAKLAKAAVGSFGGAQLVADTEARISGSAVTWMWFEDYRGHYVFSTLFDTHFLLIWIAATAAVLAYRRALLRNDSASVAVASLAFAVATILHLYEGPTLLAIVAAVTFLRWAKGLPLRHALVTAAVLAATVGVCLGSILMLQRGSGLPMPGWAAFTIPVSIVLAAYPLAWGLMVWGGGEFWAKAGETETFLFGWVLGCTALTLAGPFYPYPDRGTMTLQVALTISAGAIWFSRRERLSLRSGVVAVAVMGMTPVWLAAQVWAMSSFADDQPHKFLDAAHRNVIETLVSRATPDDLLLVEEPDVLWLGPEYPGRLYCGHFFLTVDFEAKCAEVADALEADWPTMRDFFDEAGARFLLTRRYRALQTLGAAPQVEVLASSGSGTLFEYRPEAP